MRIWTWKPSASLLAAKMAKLEAEVADIRSGKVVLYWESPKMIRLHGRGPRDANEAADEELAYCIGLFEINMKPGMGSGQAWRLWNRKYKIGR